MSFKVTYEANGHQEVSLNVLLRHGLVKEFQDLVDAAANCRPDISPAMKELVDLITVGKVQQDYYSQAGVDRPIPF
jgi:hypothetical protein